MGVLKVPMSYVSAPVLAEVGLGMLEGGHKYGRHNYRAIGIRASMYYDAAMHHLTAGRRHRRRERLRERGDGRASKP